MTEPNILDQLFNITVKRRDVKRWLDTRAEELVARHLWWDHSESVARQETYIELTKWMQEKSLTGHGTKKLVDKAIAKAMAHYSTRLSLNLRRKIEWSDDDDAITAHLNAGQLGFGSKGRSPEWLRRQSASVGEKLADKFKQKSK